MPFDPFFSSAQKRHYVWSENYEEVVMAEVRRIRGLPRHEQGKIMAELNVKASKGTMTLSERNIRHQLSVLWKVKHDAVRRRARWAIGQKHRKGGPTFCGGFNTGAR